MKVEVRGDFHEVIGDDLFAEFEQVSLDQGQQRPCKEGVRQFVNWLVFTTTGAIALGRIKHYPRQLTLPFPDDDRPWRVIDVKEES